MSSGLDEEQLDGSNDEVYFDSEISQFRDSIYGFPLYPASNINIHLGDRIKVIAWIAAQIELPARGITVSAKKVEDLLRELADYTSSLPKTLEAAMSVLAIDSIDDSVEHAKMYHPNKYSVMMDFMADNFTLDSDISKTTGLENSLPF